MIGHELAGLVEKVGGRVCRVREGDRMVEQPVIVCDRCEFCLSDRYKFCSDINFQYRKGKGGFASYFICNKRWAHPLPTNATYEEGGAGGTVCGCCSRCQQGR